MANLKHIPQCPSPGRTANLPKRVIIIILLMTACGGSEYETTGEENRILETVLRKERPSDGYMIVLEQTELFHSSCWEDESRKQKWLKDENIDPELFENFLQRNKRPFRISLKSDQKNGYYVDSDSSLVRRYYHEDEGWDWARLQNERPKAAGFTALSRPAYDDAKNIVIVYRGQGRSDGDDYGQIILYEYRNGELKEIRRIGIWIS